MMAGQERFIRCQKCPVLVKAKPQQYVGVCPKCRATGDKLHTARKRPNRAKADTPDDPCFIFCIDCPRAFEYRGGVPHARCPACENKHAKLLKSRKPRTQRRYDETHGRGEIHATRGGALSAYLRSRNR